jgi:hypothetical protein
MQRPQRPQPTAGGPQRSGPPPAPPQPPAAPAAKAPDEGKAREEDGNDPGRRRGFFNRQSILLIAVIVVALVVGGLAGGELYARHRADVILVEVAECVVKDGATISFGVNPPFLWQHMTGHYTNISVATDGNRVQDAKGMTADVTLEDIRLQETADSKGTIGSLNATLAWTAAGIKDTVAENLPGIGNLVTEVSTDAGAGTIGIKAGVVDVTAKPVVNDGNLDLQVVTVSGPFAQDAVQTALNDLTKKLNDNYPLGIHADSVEVTDAGVVGKFSSQNASIPNSESNACFASL